MTDDARGVNDETAEQPAVEPAPDVHADHEAAAAVDAEPVTQGMERNDPTARRRARTIRLAVLVAILGLVTLNGYLHQHPIGGLRTVGVDALCPFGGLEALWSVISGGPALQHIATSTFILFGFALLAALVFRRVFCGYVCPLGTLQELFGKIGHRIWGRKRPVVPEAVDRPARYLKYVVLIVITLWTWQAATLVIRGFDPWVAYMHLSSGEVFAEFSLGLIVLGVSLVGSTVYDRFFCKYLCPMGALLAVVSRVAPFAVRRNAATCISCSACDKACPVNIEVSSASTVTSAECISCNECVNACPVADTLVYGGRVAKSRLVLAPAHVMAYTLLVLGLVVGVTTVAGSFAWTMPSRPTVTDGQIDPESIRGYMSFEDIAIATGIPPSVFEQQFGIVPQDMTTPIKDLAPVYGFDVHTDVRDFVAEQLAAGAAMTPGTPTEGG